VERLIRAGGRIMASNPNELTMENSAVVLIDHQPAVALCAPSLRTDVLVTWQRLQDPQRLWECRPC